MTIRIDISGVTQEQLDRCTRIVNQNTGEVFYQVESESDSTVEYEVHYSKERGFSCGCKCGQNGFANCKKSPFCKHVTWAVAHAVAYREERREQSQIERYVRQGIDRETAMRVTYSQPTEYTEAAIKRDQERSQRKPFSILR